MQADKGFKAPAVLAVDVAIPATKYSNQEERNRFHDRLLAALETQPGIVSAAICTALPLTGETWVDAAWAPGDTRYWDWAPRQVTLAVRAAGDPRSAAGTIRGALRSVDPDLPVPEMRTMQEILEQSVEIRRFQMLLAAAFAATALLLAALGIYGVVSYAVVRRTNEMGIRLALGARPRDLHRMIVAQVCHR
jgi:hypothetical protein